MLSHSARKVSPSTKSNSQKSKKRVEDLLVALSESLSSDERRLRRLRTENTNLSEVKVQKTFPPATPVPKNFHLKSVTRRNRMHMFARAIARAPEKSHWMWASCAHSDAGISCVRVRTAGSASYARCACVGAIRYARRPHLITTTAAAATSRGGTRVTRTHTGAAHRCAARIPSMPSMPSAFHRLI